MAYHAQVNQRKHKRLIGDTTTDAENLEAGLVKLQAVARNEPTIALLRDLHIMALRMQRNLYQMMEIARTEPDDEP